MGALHPQVVHFAIVLLLVGVALRLLSLANRWSWMHPAATASLLAGTLAAVVAVQTGAAAHGPVERVPLSRPAVVAHEEWGERTRNVFLAVAALELLALALRRSPRARLARSASAVLGVVGALCVFEAGEHGGALVYSYAGGVGIRSGEPEDVRRLLLAGLYHQALADRGAGRDEDASALAELALSRFPNDAEVQMFAAESRLLDRKDPAGALATLRTISVSPDNRILRPRLALLTADALVATGALAEAVQVVESALEAFPRHPRLTDRLAQLKETASGAPQ